MGDEISARAWLRDEIENGCMHASQGKRKKGLKWGD